MEEVDTSPSIDESLGAEKQAGGGTRKAQQQERKDEELIASPDSDGLLKGHSKTKRYDALKLVAPILILINSSDTAQSTAYARYLVAQ